MILLSLVDVLKRYGAATVLDGASGEVRPGQRIGLVGPNGTGKTTLLKIIAGREAIDSGSCELHPNAQLGYLEQHPQFAPGRTLWQEAESGLAALFELGREAEEAAKALASTSDEAQRARLAARYDQLQHELARQDAYHLDHKIERVLDGLGFARRSYGQPVESLSGGQQNRLLLARLLLTKADLLLLDEPSNHLDIEATEWLEEYLAGSSQAMIVVSHDRYFLDKVTTHTWELFHGTIESYAGNFTAYWRQKAERVEVQRRTYEKQQEFVAKTEDFIRRNQYGQKHAQAKDREKKLARVERVDPPRTIEAPAFSFPPASRTGDIVARIEHLAKGYAHPLFSDLSFDILRGQRFGILGPNGSGKTTLLRCIVGEEKPDDGQIVLGAGVKLGYYDQRLDVVDPESSVVDAIRPTGKQTTEPERRDLLARFGLRGDIVFQAVARLSGGERSRAALAMLAAADSNFLVLDEPTNHLDLWARDALERALLSFDGTVLFVSHDRYFLNRVADHVLAVEPARFRVIEGNYETYLHLTKSIGTKLTAKQRTQHSNRVLPAASKTAAAEKSPPAESTKSSSAKNAASNAQPEKPARRKRKFPYRKAADIEVEIGQRERRLEDLHASLADPEIYRHGQRIREVEAQIADEKQALAVLFEHWEEAAELNG